MFFEALAHDFFDNFVGNQKSLLGDATDSRCQLGVVSNVPAEDFTDRDVDEVVIAAK